MSARNRAVVSVPSQIMAATKPVCVTCGMPVGRDWAGWTHLLPPMSMADRRKFRHVVRVQS